MKPYFLVFHNFLRFTLLKLKVKNLSFGPILMVGRNTRISFHKKSNVHLGNHIVSDGRLVMFAGEGAELSLGNRIYMNENVIISCTKKVTIGEDTLFGPSVKIYDNNHKFDPINGVKGELTSASVEIGKKCWICSNVVITKGTKIGDNCVIGAGCIVSGTIASGSIVTQNKDLIIKPMKIN